MDNSNTMRAAFSALWGTIISVLKTVNRFAEGGEAYGGAFANTGKWAEEETHTFVVVARVEREAAITALASQLDVDPQELLLAE